jgi:predicted HicB family RNase H-like nuclease
MLKYKNYPDMVEYDADARIFTGEAIGIQSVVTFEGRSPEEIERSFRESIDVYLEMCAVDGVKPDKPYSGRFNLRIPPELHREIALRAAQERKSLNEWVLERLSRSL